MALKAAKVTVGTAPTALSTEDTDSTAGYSVTFTVPTDGQVVFIGGANVTAASGFPVSPGATLSLELDTGEQVYAVTSPGQQAIQCLWRGV